MRLPLIAFLANHLKYYPTPKNINYFWSFGSLIALCLVIQIITGIFLSMHYVTNVEYAFDSVEHIMRDVQYGFLLRYLHSNGASMIFILLYIHIFRGIYYGSFKFNILVWVSGLLLFFLMMGTAFLGYVLPWGQMSLWGATVITNLASAIPFIGNKIVVWLWGGFSVDNPTLNRFFSLHYLLPFLILAFFFLHLSFVHNKGSNNPLAINTIGSKINFFPFFYVKDLFSFFIFILFFSIFLFYIPNILGHPDNYIPANSMVTPTHIVPEWYFLPFYAILRSIPNKLFGVIAMLGAILILFLFPFYTFKEGFQSAKFRPFFILFFWFFIINFFLLGWVGQQEAISYFITIGRISTFLYFFIIFNLIFLIPLLEMFINYQNREILSSIKIKILQKSIKKILKAIGTEIQITWAILILGSGYYERSEWEYDHLSQKEKDIRDKEHIQYLKEMEEEEKCNKDPLFAAKFREDTAKLQEEEEKKGLIIIMYEPCSTDEKITN